MSQRGQVWKVGKHNYAIRYYGADGLRRQRQGFRTKGEADAILQAELRKRRSGSSATGRETFGELCADFQEQYEGSASRKGVVKWALDMAQARFGKTMLGRLNTRDLGAWRQSLPEQQRHQVFAIVRQVLEQGVVWGLLPSNPARGVRNPTPDRAEVEAFDSWAELEAVCAEIPEYRPLVVFAAGTGLRPQEWAALERRDIIDGVVTVRRTVIDGVVQEFRGKTKGSIRRVPLRARVLDALALLPSRLDTRLLFPAERGGHLNVDNWRRRDWYPALLAAGLPKRKPYSLRHTYATWSIAAGVDLFVLARRMGTSVEQIDATYGHLLPRGEAHERDLLDSWDAGAEREAKDG